MSKSFEEASKGRDKRSRTRSRRRSPPRRRRSRTKSPLRCGERRERRNSRPRPEHLDPRREPPPEPRSPPRLQPRQPDHPPSTSRSQQGSPTRLQIGDRPMTEQLAVSGVTSTMHPWNSDLSYFQPSEVTADELDSLLRRGGSHHKVIWMKSESKRRFVDALTFHPSNILNGCQAGKRPCFVSTKTAGVSLSEKSLHGPRTIWCQELVW